MNKENGKKATVLDSVYLSHEPWLTVREDKIQLANGVIIPKYYVLEYPDWVNILAITREGKFVLVRQYRHALGETAYELCAGVCEREDVSPLVSAQRELLEETGYGNGEWYEYMCLSANASTVANLTHCFLATGVEKVCDPHPEATESLTVHLLSLVEVKDLLRQGAIRQSLMAAPLWKYMAEHGW